jgi:hypothetical protein
MRFLRSVAGYRRRDKKRNTDIVKKFKNIQSRTENKEIPVGLLPKYPNNANLPNPW